MDTNLLLKYFEGNVTDEQGKTVTEWIDASPENYKQYQRICRIYGGVVWSSASNEVKDHPKINIKLQPIVYRLSAAVAMFLLGFFLSNWFTPSQIPDEQMQVLTASVGNPVHIQLSDGSKVWLNAGSKLYFPSSFMGDQRKVRLEGEGFFEVFTDPEKPFIVSTEMHDVKALGTTFNVKSYKGSNAFQASLLSGKVIVTSINQEDIILKPQEIAYTTHEGLAVAEFKTMNRFLWREGILFFDDQFKDILEKLEYYYDVEILVKNDELIKGRSQCIGKFRMMDGIEHILTTFQSNFDFSFNVDKEKKTITIY